jgi:hypothetical protein
MKLKLLLAAAAITFGTVSGAQAALVTYTGADDGVSSLAQMTNSVAAETSFSSAAPGDSVITFETAVPSSVTITGGTITNNSGCGALCGFNTTSGGQNFLNLFGGSTTFTFAHPINSFGFYITGLQTNVVGQESLTFSDGSSEVIDTPSSINGGGAFIGFTDLGKSITSVTYSASNDIVSIDDVLYGSASSQGVPEPATWALMLVGIGMAGGALRTARRKAGAFAA